MEEQKETKVRKLRPALRIGVIALALVVVVAGYLLLGRRGEPVDYDVMYVHGGSETVMSFSADGSVGFSMIQNADGSAFAGGETLYLEDDRIGWPMTVTAYHNLDMQDPFCTAVLPEAPGEGEFWLLELVRNAGIWNLQATLLPKEG